MQTTMNHSDESHKKLNIGIKHDTLRKNLNMEEKVMKGQEEMIHQEKIYSNQ